MGVPAAGDRSAWTTGAAPGATEGLRDWKLEQVLVIARLLELNWWEVTHADMRRSYRLHGAPDPLAPP